MPGRFYSGQNAAKTKGKEMVCLGSKQNTFVYVQSIFKLLKC